MQNTHIVTKPSPYSHEYIGTSSIEKRAEKAAPNDCDGIFCSFYFPFNVIGELGITGILNNQKPKLDTHSYILSLWNIDLRIVPIGYHQKRSN